MHVQSAHPYHALLHAPKLLVCFFCEPLVAGNSRVTTDGVDGLYNVFNELIF